MTLKIASVFVAVTFCASTVFAQATTTQSAIVGPSGETQYPVEVVGADGVNYFCQSGTSIVNGVVARLCRRSASFGATSGTIGNTIGGVGLGGLGRAAGIGAALGAAVLIGVMTTGGSTTGTN